MINEEIKKRFLYELGQSQIILQYIEEIYSADNQKFLNQAATFFTDIYRIMVDDLSSRIMRLFDPPSSGDEQNFSLCRIMNIKNVGLLGMSEHQTDARKRLRDYRHKCLAHNDYELTRQSFPNYDEILIDGKILLNFLWIKYQEFIGQEIHNLPYVHTTAVRKLVGTLKRSVFLREKGTYESKLSADYQEWLKGHSDIISKRRNDYLD